MKYPSDLPDDWRKGKYRSRDKYKRQIVATVDVRISDREILMHNETDDLPFVISPQQLRKEWCRYEL